VRLSGSSRLFIACSAVLMAGLVVASLFAMSATLDNALSPNAPSSAAGTGRAPGSPAPPDTQVTTAPSVTLDQPAPAAMPIVAEPAPAHPATAPAVGHRSAPKAVTAVTVSLPVPSPAPSPAAASPPAATTPVPPVPPVAPGTVPAVPAVMTLPAPTTNRARPPTAATTADAGNNTNTGSNTNNTNSGWGGDHDQGDSSGRAPQVAPAPALSCPGDDSDDAPGQASDGDENPGPAGCSTTTSN
jgi:hypothetical protein